MKLAQDIVLKPVVTEHSVDLLSANKYTFKVAKTANKIEIKKAIEELFEVEVLKVHTMNCLGKTRRVGKYTGKKPDFKKAIVTINPTPDKQGKKKLKGTIEFFDDLH
jgi:large subunit ribosomal protein L23